jgi:hypothetical protein
MMLYRTNIVIKKFLLQRSVNISSFTKSICHQNQSHTLLLHRTPLIIANRYFTSFDDKHNRPSVKSNRTAGFLSSIALGGAFLFGKTKYLLAALKLTKATPLISMLLSSGA